MISVLGIMLLGVTPQYTNLPFFTPAFESIPMHNYSSVKTTRNTGRRLSLSSLVIRPCDRGDYAMIPLSVEDMGLSRILRLPPADVTQSSLSHTSHYNATHSFYPR